MPLALTIIIVAWFNPAVDVVSCGPPAPIDWRRPPRPLWMMGVHPGQHVRHAAGAHAIECRHPRVLIVDRRAGRPSASRPPLSYRGSALT